MIVAILVMGCGSFRIHQQKKDWAYFEDWDRNHNSSLDRAEFAQGYDEAEFFSRWNTKLKPINSSDFLRKTFNVIDENKDNILDSIEYKSRRALWTLPGDMDLSRWDADHDKTLAIEEFNQAASQNLLHTFDQTADGQITESEMSKAMFEVCDKNGDDQVKGAEFYLWEVYRR